MAMKSLFNRAKELLQNKKQVNSSSPYTQIQKGTQKVIKQSFNSPSVNARMKALRDRKIALQKQRYKPKVQQAQPMFQNAFLTRLQRRKRILDYEEARRQRLAYPKGYARTVNDMHDADRNRRRKFAQDNGITKAHEGMDMRQMDFLETKNSILMAENIFSSSNPRRMDITRTGRPNILQVPYDDNILNTKLKLKFGRT